MVRKRKIYRRQNALLGGVCAGIANRYELDPIAVRLLFVGFGFATCGVLALVYTLLWLVLPLEPCSKEPSPSDELPAVAPSNITVKGGGSHTLEEATEHLNRRRKTAAAAAEVGKRYGAVYQVAQSMPVVRVGVAHTPPAPPGVVGPIGEALPVASCECEALEPTSLMRVYLALLAGSVLLFSGISWFATVVIHEVEWWQFWPLLIMIWGIFAMTLPAEIGRRMTQFVGGLVACSAGLVLLNMSLGIVLWESWQPIVEYGWVLICAILVCLLVSVITRSPAFLLLAGLSFSLLCVLGLAWFAIPGQPIEVYFDRLVSSFSLN